MSLNAGKCENTHRQSSLLCPYVTSHRNDIGECHVVQEISELELPDMCVKMSRCINSVTQFCIFPNRHSVVFIKLHAEYELPP